MSEDGQNYTMFSSRMLVDTVGDTTDAALEASGLREVIGVLAGRIFNWGQRKSLFPLHLGIKCCALRDGCSRGKSFRCRAISECSSVLVQGNAMFSW